MKFGRPSTELPGSVKVSPEGDSSQPEDGSNLEQTVTLYIRGTLRFFKRNAMLPSAR